MCSCSKPRPTRGRMRIHCLENVDKALQFLKEQRVHLENVGSHDIVDGNHRLTLGLIWTIILRFQVRTTSTFSTHDQLKHCKTWTKMTRDVHMSGHVVLSKSNLCGHCLVLDLCGTGLVCKEKVMFWHCWGCLISVCSLCPLLSVWSLTVCSCVMAVWLYAKDGPPNHWECVWQNVGSHFSCSSFDFIIFKSQNFRFPNSSILHGLLFPSKDPLCL